jgi:hypothetical protein
MANTTIPSELIADGAITSAKLDTNIAVGGTLNVSGDANFDSNTLFVDASANAVGIGNNSPTDKLNISSGTNQIGLDTGNQATYGTLDIGHFTNGAFIGTQAGSNAASNILRFGTSGSERLRIAADGNVGIGTSSPGDSLHLKNNSSFQLRFDSSGANKWRLGAGWSGFYEESFIISDTNAGNRLVIDPNGNVGIGTSSPANALTVNSGTTNTVAQFISTDSGAGIKLTDNVGSSSVQTTDEVLRIGVDEDAAVASSAIAFRVDGSEKVRIDSSGNVGIGTTSPFSKLHVGSRGSASVLSYGSSGDGIVFDFYNLAGSPYTRYANIVSSSSDTSESRLGLWTQAASGTSSEKLTILLVL